MVRFLPLLPILEGPSGASIAARAVRSTFPRVAVNPTQPQFQLRIDFDGLPTRSTEVRLELVGVRVHVTPLSGLPADVWGYLSALGVSARVEEGSPILFNVSELPKLADLPSQVVVRPSANLSTLYQLAIRPPSPGIPITVHHSQNGLDLRWFDGTADRTATLPTDAVPAFLTLGFPFLATVDAWDELLMTSELPPRVGTVRINLDGFCEISAVTPQLVESAPLPGLFRLGPTRFGLPLRYAAQIQDLRGFVWEGRTPPRPHQIPLVDFGLPLRPHLREHIPAIATALAADGGHLLAWESGLGRRLGAVGALEALDAYPAVVVCPPWRVWLWMRQLSELGHSVSLGSRTAADVSITTYHDLSISSDRLSPVAIVFDAPDTSEAQSAFESLRALVTAYPDAYRLGVVSSLPEDPSELARLLDLVRPGEFDFRGPLQLRYPGDAEASFASHAACYHTTLTRSDIPDEPEPSRLSSSTVEVCSLPSELAYELSRIRSDVSMSLRDRLSASMEVISVGTSTHPSPKLARALHLLKESYAAGRKVAVLLAQPRAVALLRIALTPARVELAEGTSAAATTQKVLATPGPAVLLVHHPSASVDLSMFDDVLVYDYPWNMAVVDAMVGSSALNGPETLTVLHLTDTIDDRLALSATLRRSRQFTDPSASLPPSDDSEIAYLLAPRYRVDPGS